MSKLSPGKVTLSPRWPEYKGDGSGRFLVQAQWKALVKFIYINFRTEI